MQPFIDLFTQLQANLLTIAPIVAVCGVALWFLMNALMVTRQECADYVFLGAEYVHPTTIRRGWQRIAMIDWTPRRVVDRMVESPRVTLTPHALWEQTI